MLSFLHNLHCPVKLKKIFNYSLITNEYNYKNLLKILNTETVKWNKKNLKQTGVDCLPQSCSIFSLQLDFLLPLFRFFNFLHPKLRVYLPIAFSQDNALISDH